MLITSLVRAAYSQPVFKGAWKYTYATENPARARDFAIRYLHAHDFGRPRGRCGDIQWVYWPNARTQGANVARWGRESSHLHLHFVRQTRRPTGALPISEFEQLRSKLHRGLAPHDLFAQTSRVTLEARSLAPLVRRMQAHSIPFVVLPNMAGYPSLFVEIPTAILVEIVAPHETSPAAAQALAQSWQRCGGTISPPPPVPAASQPGGSGEDAAGVIVVRAKRFVFTSTNPRRSATFVARYLFGELTLSSTPDTIGGGSCVESASVRWSQLPDADVEFEMTWVRPSERERASRLPLAEEERFLSQVHGNLSLASPTDWDAYMDYHPGILFDDCDPLLRRLLTARVPFFRARHGCDRHRVINGKPTDSCMSVFIADEHTGQIYEAMCYAFSVLGVDDLPEFDQCLHPAAEFSARVARVAAPVLAAEPERAPSVPAATSYSKRAVTSNLEENRHQPHGPEATGLRWPSWHRLQDREHMRTVTFPLAGRLAGDAGLVLDLGVQAYSADDRTLAGVPADRWYFCDPDPGPVPPGSGVVVRSTLANLTHARPELAHQFAVVIDYGVLGALAKNGVWTLADMKLHVSAYAGVLRPGGTVLLKWDFTLVRYTKMMNFPIDAENWRHVRHALSLQLHFAEEYMQVSPACPREAAARLRALISDSEAEIILQNFTYTSPGIVQQRCGYTFSRWTAPGGSVSAADSWFGFEASTKLSSTDTQAPCRCPAAKPEPTRQFIDLKVEADGHTDAAAWTVLASEEGAEAVLSGKAALRELKVVTPPGFHEGCADPFVINRTLTCEMLRKTADVAPMDAQGVIGIGVIGTDLRAPILLRIAIEEPWHLSYPYSFVEGGRLFVVIDANQYRQSLFKGVSLLNKGEGNEGSVRLGGVYDCGGSLPCAFVRQLTPGSSQYADGNLLPLRDGIAFTAFPHARSSNQEKRCGRHSKTWLTRSSSVATGAFEHSCFPERGPYSIAGGGRSAGRLRRYTPLQYNPEYYGQYVDLYEAASGRYVRTLRFGSKYCGVHHVAEDPSSSLVVVDARVPTELKCP